MNKLNIIWKWKLERKRTKWNEFPPFQNLMLLYKLICRQLFLFLFSYGLQRWDELKLPKLYKKYSIYYNWNLLVFYFQQQPLNECIIWQDSLFNSGFVHVFHLWHITQQKRHTYITCVCIYIFFWGFFLLSNPYFRSISSGKIVE